MSCRISRDAHRLAIRHLPSPRDIFRDRSGVGEGLALRFEATPHHAGRFSRLSCRLPAPHRECAPTPQQARLSPHRSRLFHDRHENEPAYCDSSTSAFTTCRLRSASPLELCRMTPSVADHAHAERHAIGQAKTFSGDWRCRRVSAPCGNVEACRRPSSGSVSLLSCFAGHIRPACRAD